MPKTPDGGFALDCTPADYYGDGQKGARRAAIVYDFDGTLARGNIQEHSFIPALGIDVQAFWAEVKREAERHNGDEILIYMWCMLEQARAKSQPVTRDALEQHGRVTPLFDGLDSWFDRVNTHAAKRELEVEHYVVSSGLYEMIRGCTIFDRFKQVFASHFVYDDRGVAVWPAVAINYTTKTQYLFRINKGIDNSWDNERINRWQPMRDRPIPFERMIFIGDGETDIPSMKMVRQQGGHSIAVFDPKRWESGDSQEKIARLIAEDRVHFVAPADYRSGGQLDVTVRGILGKIANGL